MQCCSLLFSAYLTLQYNRSSNHRETVCEVVSNLGVIDGALCLNLNIKRTFMCVSPLGQQFVWHYVGLYWVYIVKLKLCMYVSKTKSIIRVSIRKWMILLLLPRENALKMKQMTQIFLTKRNILCVIFKQFHWITEQHLKMLLLMLMFLLPSVTLIIDIV